MIARLMAVAVAMAMLGCRRPPPAPGGPASVGGGRADELDAGAVGDGGRAPPDAAAPPIDAAVDAPPPRTPTWLRGSTHVHAAPSGDAIAAPEVVMAWYRDHGYDFIVLTDHNRVTIIDPAEASSGSRTSAAPASGPLVIAGTELTYNPAACTEPPPPPSGKCRIHVNGLGLTGRAEGRIEWADRKRRDRRASYQAAVAWIARRGGLPQINHPQWSWGMTPELLTALAADGAALVEIANVAFAGWNAGAADHLSTEALWERSLQLGARLWAVASDDAHSYDGKGGKYPAGGGWVMVDAARDADAIVAALAAGRFYASTGVTLARAGVEGDALVVEVASDQVLPWVIEVIVDGAVVVTSSAPRVEHRLPATGYVRARVTRTDGAQAWVQPAWR